MPPSASPFYLRLASGSPLGSLALGCLDAGGRGLLRLVLDVLGGSRGVGGGLLDGGRGGASGAEDADDDGNEGNDDGANAAGNLGDELDGLDGVLQAMVANRSTFSLT